MSLDLRRQTLLIIAPHLDDEVIGCAGLITRVKAAGGKVFVQFLVNGDTTDYSQNPQSSRSIREKELDQVAAYLHFDKYDIAYSGSDYHLKLDHITQYDLVNLIEKQSALSLELIKPTIVLSPHPSSYNQDHRAAAHATLTACRPASPKLKHQPPLVLFYESPADQWTFEKPASPNFFLKLTKNEFDRKLHALTLYKSQMRTDSNPRSLKVLTSLAVLRGSQVGHAYAEAYFCNRFLMA